MAQESGRIDVPSGGNSMPPALLAAITQGLAGVGGPAAARADIVPLWRARPRTSRERINPGMVGDDRNSLSQRITMDYTDYEARKAFTPEYAASSFLDMSDKDRAEFEHLAIMSGLVKPGSDPDAIASAWQRAVGYTANYNQDRDEAKWISPWEAVQRLGAQQAAREGGAYDPFKPRTITQSQTVKRDFTSGQDAEGVTRTLESLFAAEMGRAPTESERKVYQKLVQTAYDASPEVNRSKTTTDAAGNSTTEATQSGGIDQTATLLDQVRSDPESQAYDGGVTFFNAAMQALGAIA